MTEKKRTRREDELGSHRVALAKNKKKIFATQQVCAICGQPVDFSIKYPDPMSATVDHIIPITRGGHPSDIDNLQLAHNTCNRAKSDKVDAGIKLDEGNGGIVSNNLLPQSMDWSKYNAGKTEKKQLKF